MEAPGSLETPVPAPLFGPLGTALVAVPAPACLLVPVCRLIPAQLGAGPSPGNPHQGA